MQRRNSRSLMSQSAMGDMYSQDDNSGMQHQASAAPWQQQQPMEPPSAAPWQQQKPMEDAHSQGNDYSQFRSLSTPWQQQNSVATPEPTITPSFDLSPFRGNSRTPWQ